MTYDNPALKIMFIDDEPNILMSLERMMRRARPNWQPIFISEPEAALEAMDNMDIDVVVTDIRMPNISGHEIIKHVKANIRQIQCIALSGQCSWRESEIIRGNGAEFLAKPVSANALVDAVERLTFAIEKNNVYSPIYQTDIEQAVTLLLLQMMRDGKLLDQDIPASLLERIGPFVSDAERTFAFHPDDHFPDIDDFFGS